MLKRVLFILIYLLSWVAFFELARIFFLLSTWEYATEVPRQLIFQSLWYGLKMDFSMASYITVLVCLFSIAGIFIPFFRTKKIYIFYSALVLFLLLLLIIVDAEVFKAWGNRIDFTPLKYLSNPKEMMASVSHLPVFWILAAFIIVYLLLVWGFGKIILKSMPLLQNTRVRWLQSIIVFICMGLLIIPIRGGVQLSPLNQSSVFFCNNQYANNAAINATWNFMHSISLLNQLKGNPYVYMDEEISNQIVNDLYNTESKNEQVINVSDSVRPNIILITWESFTEKVLHLTIEEKKVVPYFNELIKEGIYFSNCYSSGDRTDKGISAILSAYPALPKGSIVNYPGKTARLPGLGNLFFKNGFATNFYYGGEPEFANIKSYLTTQNFQKYTTKDDFSSADMNSKWGAHDGVVMNKILNDLPQTKQPFFTTWLTLSSHEPFETPVPSTFKGKDKESKFLNSLHYTDSVVYAFIGALKKMPLWKNTLVIISADHGHYLPITGKRADDYHIPVLWLGGALTKNNIIVEKTVSQLDIAGSLTQQFHFSENTFRFSKNLFDSSSKHFAFFTFNDGIGYVTDSSRTLFDNAGKKVVFEEGKSGVSQTNIVKALMQVIYADFLKK